MRVHRVRHEVMLMVRYPENERRSLVNFREIRVSDPEGNEHPIEELAEITLERGASEINRVDQLRSITISADLDDKKANSSLIIQDLKSNFFPDPDNPEAFAKFDPERIEMFKRKPRATV